jgi:hypothetical protein
MEIKNPIFYMNFISNFMTNNVYNYYPGQLFSNSNQNINNKTIEKTKKNVHRENFIPKSNFIKKNYSSIDNNLYTVYNNLNINNNVNNYFIIQNNFTSPLNYQNNSLQKNNLQNINIQNNNLLNNNLLSNNLLSNNSNNSSFIEEQEIPIFQIKLKLSLNQDYTTFKLYRNDNLFIKFKIFCNENNIPIALYKPLIIQIISSMNKFHYLFNKEINLENFDYLLSIWKEYNHKNI